MKHRSSELTFADMFCGAGGSTIGAMRAGAVPRFALNHWARAVETYNANHTDGPAKLADVSMSNPRHYPSTDILIASPECTFHSPARGDKKPSNQGDLYGDGPGTSEEGERSRATMWDVPRFAEIHNYETVVIENVVEAKTKWPTFDAWLYAMRQLGYESRELYLNSMFFGAPQSRDRLYVVFWKRGNRKPNLEFHPVAPCWNCGEWVAAIQSWKNPHKPYGKYRTQYVYCCPTCAKEVRPMAPPAAVAIDWSLKGERIGDRKKALAPATMARIQAGIDKYWRKPGVVDLAYDGVKVRSVDDPLFAQTARATLALYLPFLARMRGTDEGQIAGSAHSVTDPMGTLTAGGKHEALIEGPEPFYVKNFGDIFDAPSMAKLVGQPLGTITNVDHHALVMPSGGTWNTDARGSGDPLPTLTASEAWALVTQIDMAFKGHLSGRVRDVLEQLATITARGGENTALVTAYRSRESAIQPADRPLSTQTAEPTHGLLRPFLAKAAGSTFDTGKSYKRVRGVEEQLWAQTGTTETAVISREAFLQAYYGGSDVLRHVSEAMSTLTATDRQALVERGQEIDIEDCYFRMFEPPEIGRGMAFPDSYKVTGNKRERVRQYGGAVTPPVEDAIMSRCIAALDSEIAA